MVEFTEKATGKLNQVLLFASLGAKPKSNRPTRARWAAQETSWICWGPAVGHVLACPPGFSRRNAEMVGSV